MFTVYSISDASVEAVAIEGKIKNNDTKGGAKKGKSGDQHVYGEWEEWEW